jgi:GNAT superfamily N-acetyltransferase
VTESELVDDAFTVRPLAPATWDAFADLADRHNGVWGGCWCTWFHTMHDEKTFDADDNRALKERLVNEGRAHAALVFDGDEAVAWCQFGSPQELPNIKHRKEYEAELDSLPDYRLTCFFVDKRYRRRGVSALALQGALDLIAKAGGGVVEAYPPGHRRQEDHGIVPLQRHPQPLRAGRLQLRAPQREEPHRHAQGGQGRAVVRRPRRLRDGFLFG